MVTEARRRQIRRRRVFTAAVSVGGHLAVVLALVNARPTPPVAVEPPVIAVELITPPPPVITPPTPPTPEPPDPAPPPKTPPKPEKPKPPPPPRPIARPAKTPPPPNVVPILAGEGPSADGVSEVSDSELAGAATAGSGAAGGACNMPRRLQAALRKDRQVQRAVAEAHRGKAIRVWNGDWVRHGVQEGAGLAAVREAIMWEVGFAPEACRKERVQGLVMISLNDSPGSARLVMGSGQWRWSDLLFARSGGASRR